LFADFFERCVIRRIVPATQLRHVRKFDYSDTLRPRIVGPATAVPLAFEDQELVGADQDLATKFTDACFDMVVALKALGIGDLATMDDKISGHRNLLAR